MEHSFHLEGPDLDVRLERPVEERQRVRSGLGCLIA